MKVLITDTQVKEPDIEIKILKDAGIEVVTAQCKSDKDIIAAASDVDALLVTYANVSRAVFESCPNIRMISRNGIGVDSIDLKAAEDHGVWVSNVPDYGYDEVPTHAISLMFSLLRNITFHDRNVRNGLWNFSLTGRVDRIADMTLGVLGLGRLGKFTMELAKPFFKNVVAYDPYLSKDKWPQGVRNALLNEVFQLANVITLHLPLSSETNQIVSKEVLDQIPDRGAYLVNTARGGLIDLDAALLYLNQGKLLGIGLDVMPVEPPPKDHPIIRHDRAIVTPHTAWYSTASVIDLRQKFANNVVCWVRDGVAPNAVVKGKSKS